MLLHRLAERITDLDTSRRRTDAILVELKKKAEAATEEEVRPGLIASERPPPGPT